MAADQRLAGANSATPGIPRVEQRSSIDAGQVCVNANLAIPAQASGWVILVPPSSGHAPSDALFNQVAAQLHQLGLATMLVDLGAPRVTARYMPSTSLTQSARRLCVATDWLREHAEWQGLPLHYFGVGRGAAVALRAATTAEVSSIVAWNGRPELAWRQLRAVPSPTLLLLGGTRPRLRWWCNRLADRRMGALAQLLLLEEKEQLAAQIASWAERDHTFARARYVSARRTSARRPALVRHAATGALALSLGLPMAAIPAAAQSAHVSVVTASAGVPQAAITSAAPADPFADGITISADAIHGDSATPPPPSGKGKARRKHRGYTYQDGAVQGDGITTQSTGSIALIDAGGLKWFANTNITFSTSSSASAAMSEASFVHPVAATTLNGGTTASTLNDAFDGYNALCVSFTGAAGPCSTGNANYTIYNKNGPATTECPGVANPAINRQVVFKPQTMGNGITVSRKVFVPDNDTFARWQNFFTNTSAVSQTMTISTGNNLGSDSNTVLVSSSNGDAIANVTDTWLSSFQNYSGTTSSDVRLGHVLQGPGALVPMSGINFQNGDDNPYWAYTFTLAPGETKSILNFATGQPTKAAANAKAAELVGLPPNALLCMTPTERSEVVNFAVASDLGIAATATPDPVLDTDTLTYKLQVNNAGPSPASTVMVTDTLPSGVTFVSASGTGWVCSAVGGVVTCTATTLALGQAPDITITTTAHGSGPLSNTATVSTTTNDANSTNNSTTITSNAALSADLALALSAVPASVKVNSNLTYTINVANNGPSSAVNVGVHDTLPPGVTFVSASGTGWTCAQAGGVITCTLATLAPGAATPITVVVKPTTIGPSISTANVTSDATDTVPGNNSASATTTVSMYKQLLSMIDGTPALPDLLISEVALSPNKLSFAAGEPVTIRVKITNRGASAAAPFWVDLYLNPSSPPTAANQPWNTRCGLLPCFGIAWAVDGLAPGESITLSSANVTSGYSIWPGWFARGTSDLYVYADSYNLGVETGAVAESSESNNQFHMGELTVTGTNPALANLQSITDVQPRPVRVP